MIIFILPVLGSFYLKLNVLLGYLTIRMAMPVSLSTILFKTKHLSNIRFDLLLPSDFVQLSDDAQRLDLDLDLV